MFRQECYVLTASSKEALERVDIVYSSHSTFSSSLPLPNPPPHICKVSPVEIRDLKNKNSGEGRGDMYFRFGDELSLPQLCKVMPGYDKCDGGTLIYLVVL